MIRDWFSKALSESNGTPSSLRIALWVVIAVVTGLVVYFIAQNALHNKAVDCPKNLADLLSVTIGSLSAAKLGSKFGEERPSRTPSPRDLDA
jgi:hypothetical protein